MFKYNIFIPSNTPNPKHYTKMQKNQFCHSIRLIPQDELASPQIRCTADTKIYFKTSNAKYTLSNYVTTQILIAP